ncbi:hypothetical protein [Desulfomonile tiedjei]|uniref:Uncharacterized protein n=1 Tax=Desulfomonile tiedjei (strain ATCC 49306 / DSM 6799 / DCB-1) TaxID=706587 RepID=I4C9Y7_DESTA|nr:hypothetical protein [Desulfomonile tiedjei]AFM26378.1 hypothetical protein Desti_3734 [Desulfomonile tiedjei DSM 6799]
MKYAIILLVLIVCGLAIDFVLANRGEVHGGPAKRLSILASRVHRIVGIIAILAIVLFCIRLLTYLILGG